jgi:hypothetical protein
VARGVAWRRAGARRLLRTILVGHLTLTPDDRAYRFEGETVIGDVLLGSVGLDQLMWRAQGDATKVGTLKFSGIAA